MSSSKRLRYGLRMAIAHLLVIAILIPFDVLCRATRVGTIAFQIHYIVDAPVWRTTMIASILIAFKPVRYLTTIIFPGPSASSSIIGLELVIFGVTGGLLYFAVGVIYALLADRWTTK
jgi:hypothetical protein